MNVMKFLKLFSIFLLASFLCSCAAMDSLTKRAPEPSLYFAGVEGLKVFPAPRFSEECVAKLKLNDELHRYRVEKGFAYVKVVKTGQEGWVENARLAWKKEALKKPEKKEPVVQENRITEPDEAHPENLGNRGASIFDAF